MNKNIAILFIGLCLLGIIDTSYLIYNHYFIETLNCSTGWINCDVVNNNQYSYIFGLPVSIYGFIYYLVLLVALILLKTKTCVECIKKLKKYIGWLISAGLLMSLWFTYVQIFIIKSICLFCLLSALITLILFFFYIFSLRKN